MADKIPNYAKGFKHSRRSIKYAKDVVEGKISASLSIRLEATRFLKELELEKNKDWLYYFDRVAAEKICCFMETLQHVKGKWTRSANKFLKLEPWQEFICVNVFGWKKKSDNLRRYLVAYIEVPRKNGKSFFSAGFGLYMFCVDREPGSEVYCGATNLEQAMHVFKPARLMCEKNKPLINKYSIEIKKEIMELPDGSVFKPIVGEAHDGASPHCSILDEVHEHPNDSLYQSQVTGMGGRDQPLVLMITTAGKNLESFCKEQHDYVLNNQKQDINSQDLTTFGVIYSIDKNDDPYTLDSIIKANPNFGVSVREDYVLRQLNIAKKSIKDRADFLTKHLNIWVNAKSSYFDSLLWNELADRSLNIHDFLKDPCYIAVDLSAKYDLAAIVLCFIRVINGVKHYYVFTNTYLPSDTIEDTTNLNYKIYQRFVQIENKNSLNGKVLTEIPGAEIDGEFVYNELETLLKMLGNIQMILYDPWHTSFIMQQLAKAHPSFAIRIVELNQNTRNLNAGMKEVTSAMLAKRLHHDGSESLAWNIGNVTSKQDKKGNDFPDKENKNSKIDSAVCLIMCCSKTNEYVQKTSLTQRILNGGAIGTLNV